MAANTQFSVAVHALSVLAFRGQTTSSETIAQSVNTNPVVVRRLLGALAQAGLVRSIPGKGGGFELTRSADRIGLADVYRAVEGSPCFRVHDNPQNPACPVSCAMKGVLTSVQGRVDRAVEQELALTTLRDVVAEFT